MGVTGIGGEVAREVMGGAELVIESDGVGCRAVVVVVVVEDGGSQSVDG